MKPFKALNDLPLSRINRHIQNELKEAGILPVKIPRLNPHEKGPCGAEYIGVKSSYIFYRSFAYWTVIGDVPFTAAKIIEEKTKARIIGNFFGWDLKKFKEEYPLNKAVPNYQIDSKEDLKEFVNIIVAQGLEAS